jgi:hypothetical protein
MAKKKNRELSNYERRRLRIQQVIFIAIGVLVILSMVISLFINLQTRGELARPDKPGIIIPA